MAFFNLNAPFMPVPQSGGGFLGGLAAGAAQQNGYRQQAQENALDRTFRGDQADLSRTFQGDQANLDRTQRKEISDAELRLRQIALQQQEAAANRSYGLQMQSFNQAKVPAGFRVTEEGGLQAIPGGPADPAYLNSMGKGVGADATKRAELATQYGLDPNSEQGRAFILTGQIPKESQQQLTATDKKAILEADETVSQAQGVVPLLERAQALSPQANSGYFASTRAALGNNLPDWMVPDRVSSPQSSLATAELDNVVQAQALQQLKAIFGGAPTEGERKILLDISGASSQPPAVREAIFKRAQEAVDRRIQFNQQRANELRGGEYYKPAGARDQTQQNAPPPDPLGLR